MLYIYLGVTIKGYIQNGDMFLVECRSDLPEKAIRAIEAYPLVDQFIIPVEEIASVNEKIRQGGNLLANSYKELARLAGSRKKISN